MDILNAPSHPMSGLCQQWLALIEESKKVKHDLFGQYAKECQQFYDSVNNFMWSQEYASSQQGGYLSADTFGGNGFPSFRMTVNRVFEAVALYGPALYHRNPQIEVTPVKRPELSPYDLGLNDRDPNSAMVIQAVIQRDRNAYYESKCSANLKSFYLNWLQNESDKRTQARRAINEAIVKGMGLLETWTYSPPHGSLRYPRSRYLSCDYIYKDPDARYAEDVQWIAIKRIEPRNLVEKKFGFPENALNGNDMSIQAQNSPKGIKDVQAIRKMSKTHDLLMYYEIFSKNGFGQRLKSMDKNPQYKTQFDYSIFGDYCYLAIAPGIPFPLNVPTNILGVTDNNGLFDRAQWAVPYWMDESTNGGWPVSELSFYESTEHVWPIPLIKPAIGELRFVNWCMSFLADKVAASCKSYLGVQKQAAEEIRQQLVNQNGPFSIIEISQMMGKSISDVVSTIESPTFNDGIWKMLAEVMDLIDKRTGLTDLVYGLSGRQMRSAEEARIKNDNTTVRPDEMASRVEDWLSETAFKEMLNAAWSLEYKDFASVLGDTAADVFEQKVLAPENAFERLVREFDYRVVAGSARKQNRQAKISSMNELGQIILPTIQQFAMAGQAGPWNAFMRDYGKLIELDVEDYLVPEQPPQPSPEEQQQLEMEQQRHEQEMEQGQQVHEHEMQTRMHEADMKAREADMGVQMKAQEMQQSALEHAANIQKMLADIELKKKLAKMKGAE